MYIRLALETWIRQEGVMGVLRFVEEMILLLLSDEGGTFSQVPSRSLRYATAGSVLMDLAMENRIDTDLQHVILLDATPVGSRLLDPTLADIAAAEQKDTHFWVEHTAARADTIRAEALAGLVAQGILGRVEDRRMWVFRTTRYPDIEGEARVAVKRRIRGVLLSDDIPDPRDIMLISIAHACRVVAGLFSASESGRAVHRIAQLRRMDLISNAMSRSIDHVEYAITESLATRRR